MNSIGFDIYDGFVPTHPKILSGWNGMSNIFSSLVTETKPKTIIEVGTWKGQSAINMANCCKQNGLSSILYCVDTWLGALEFWTDATPDRNLMCKHGYPMVYYQFLSNVIHENVQDIIIPVPMPSHLASKWFSHKSIKADLIYIDGSHEYDDVVQDIIDYVPLLRSGGILFGDDFVDHWSGVKRAVREYASANSLKFEVYENNFWVIRFPCTTT